MLCSCDIILNNQRSKGQGRHCAGGELSQLKVTDIGMLREGLCQLLCQDDMLTTHAPYIGSMVLAAYVDGKEEHLVDGLVAWSS